MKLLQVLLIWACTSFALFGQSDYYRVKAEPGDGIYSILRKQGLDPVTHYEAFLNANLENIKDGSELYVGKDYKIPNALDSFKKTGVLVKLKDGNEVPIFDDELAEMSLRSRTLKNAIYYLIVENPAEPNDFTSDITKNLAASLMTHGAQVYVFGETEEKAELDKLKLTQREKIGLYIDEINKRYLQNAGRYQRLLVIRANGSVQNGDMDVAVYHHGNSKNSERFASSIQSVFEKNSVENRLYNNVDRIFQDENSIYLATNTLPTISLLTIDGQAKTAGKISVKVRTDKQVFASLIASGILNDYADLEIED